MLNAYLPNFENAPPEALDLWAWYHLVCSFGCVLWILAYICFLRKGFRDKAPAVPAIAMCLNFGWESMYLILPNFNTLWPALNMGWLLLDCLLVWQLWTYGAAMQKNYWLRKWFRVWVPAAIVIGIAGQLTFVITFQDRLALIDAFFINLVMSVLFIWAFFQREDGRGLSVAGAWLKMLGTLGTAIGAHVFLPLMNPHIEHWAFLTFLCVTILVLDLVYLYLLHFRMKQTPAPTTEVSIAPLEAAG